MPVRVGLYELQRLRKTGFAGGEARLEKPLVVQF